MLITETFLQLFLEASQHTGFARVTGIAKLGLIIVPLIAVRVGSLSSNSRGPVRLIDIDSTAVCWGLAATRLYKTKQYYILLHKYFNKRKVIETIFFTTMSLTIDFHMNSLQTLVYY